MNNKTLLVLIVVIILVILFMIFIIMKTTSTTSIPPITFTPTTVISPTPPPQTITVCNTNSFPVEVYYETWSGNIYQNQTWNVNANSCTSIPYISSGSVYGLVAYGDAGQGDGEIWAFFNFLPGQTLHIPNVSGFTRYVILNDTPYNVYAGYSLPSNPLSTNQWIIGPGQEWAFYAPEGAIFSLNSTSDLSTICSCTLDGNTQLVCSTSNGCQQS